MLNYSKNYSKKNLLKNNGYAPQVKILRALDCVHMVYGLRMEFNKSRLRNTGH